MFNTKNGECKVCGIGQVSDGVFDKKCKKCTNGFSASGRQKDCVSGRGRQVVNGKCVKCPKGSFRMEISADTCFPCPAGTFVSENGGKCNPCPAGQFSAAGATTCKPCPKGTTTFERGEASCVRVNSLSWLESWNRRKTPCKCLRFSSSSNGPTQPYNVRLYEA